MSLSRIRGLHLNKDELLSVYNLINARMCGGSLPPATIVLSDKATKKVTITPTRGGHFEHTSQQNGDIKLDMVSRDGGRTYILNPNKPLPITFYPHLAEGPEEVIWCTMWHEMCHALESINEPEDHGPNWTRRAESGGMTVSTGKNAAGEDAQVGGGHKIIPGGALDLVRQEWRRGGRATSPTQQPSVASPSAGRFAGVPSRATPQPIAAPRGLSPSTAPRTPGRFSPVPPTVAPSNAPRVTAAAIPEKAKRVFVYCDCSGSMYGGGSEVMASALAGLWPIKGAQLFAYADIVRQINSPDDLRRDNLGSLDVGGGTSFEAIMLHAEQHSPDMVLIFSDGQPCDERETWDVWDRTDFPISTHYCVNIGYTSDKEAVQYMIDLCRGGGEATIGDEPIDIQEGVKRAMTNSRNPRQLPDLTPRIKTGIARIQGKLGIGKRIVELGDEVEDAKFNNAVGQAINAIDGTFDHLAGELDGLFGQAFDGQREQSKVNAQHWEDAADKLNDGLGKLSTKLLGAAKGEIEGTLVAGQQRIAATRARPDAVRVGGVQINPNLLARSAAVRAANNNGARALPAPSNIGSQRALPAPSAPPLGMSNEQPIPVEREAVRVGGERANTLAGRFRRGQ